MQIIKSLAGLRTVIARFLVVTCLLFVSTMARASLVMTNNISIESAVSFSSELRPLGGFSETRRSFGDTEVDLGFDRVLFAMASASPIAEGFSGAGFAQSTNEPPDGTPGIGLDASLFVFIEFNVTTTQEYVLKADLAGFDAGHITLDEGS